MEVSEPSCRKVREIKSCFVGLLQVVRGYARLKVLHLAHNELQQLLDADVAKLELLQELNVSGNQLRNLPAALGHLPRLTVLKVGVEILRSDSTLMHGMALFLIYCNSRLIPMFSNPYQIFATPTRCEFWTWGTTNCLMCL